MTNHTPTPEQQQAIDLFLTESDLIVEAGAGTGKTSTLLLMAAASPERTGQYTAFNRALVDEAKAKFAGNRNMNVNTVHSLAYQAVVKGTPYVARLKSAMRLKPAQLADILGIKRGITFQADGGERKLSRGYLAGYVLAGIGNFVSSADTAPNGRHLPYIEGIDADGEYTNNNAVRDQLEAKLHVAWADLTREVGNLPFKHEHYLKIWELSNPYIDADYLLVDEAQDISPVMESIFFQQVDHLQIVLVGDSNQEIYGWMGAKNSMERFRKAHPDTPVTFLTQSFRFGTAVADVANSILGTLPTEMRLKGFEQIDSSVGTLTEPDAYLTRTNAAAVSRLIIELNEGRKAHLVGGGSEVVAFAKGAKTLMEQGWSSHRDLAAFDNWAEVQDYVQNDAQGGDLRLLVKLIDDYGVDQIINALSSQPKEADADLIISTAHKSKGREWNHVQLGGDFPKPKEGQPLPGAEELRLLYVAVTRAQLTLDIDDVDVLTKLLGTPAVQPVD